MGARAATRVTAEPSCRRELREDEAGVDQAADRVMRVAIPRRASAPPGTLSSMWSRRGRPAATVAGRHPGRGQARPRHPCLMAELVRSVRAEGDVHRAERQGPTHARRVPRDGAASRCGAGRGLAWSAASSGDPAPGDQGRSVLRRCDILTLSDRASSAAIAAGRTARARRRKSRGMGVGSRTRSALRAECPSRVPAGPHAGAYGPGYYTHERVRVHQPQR